LDRTPLGVLTRASDHGPHASSDHVAYDHLSDPSLSFWADILNDRPTNHTLGADRRLPYQSTQSSLTSHASSSSPRSEGTPTPIIPVRHDIALPHPTGPAAGSWRLPPHTASPSMATWASVTTPSPHGPGQLVSASADHPPDDRFQVLLDQMTALTHAVTSLVSRIPPTPPPSDSK
jgi:hypothetical protein